MRPIWVAVGAVLIVVGVVLLYVPFVPQKSITVPASQGPPDYEVGTVPGSSLTGKIPVAFAWTSSVTVTVYGGTCSNPCSNYSELSGIVVQTGTSGTFTVQQPVGGTIFVGANTSTGPAGSVSVKVTTAFSTLGSLFVIGGVALALVGLVIRPKRATSALGEAPPPPDEMGSPGF